MRLIRAKTDKKDAQVIAKYGAEQSPEPWRPAEPAMLAMQQILMVPDGLKRQTTIASNQLESLKSTGIMDDQILKSLSRVLENLHEQVGVLEDKLDDLISKTCSETVTRIEKITGIGRKTAVLLTVATQNFTRFNNSRQLIAFAGFSSRIYQSGSSVGGKGHICKMGNGHLRKLLYMCAWSAKKCNPQCPEMYNRLKAIGKPEKVIKVAIANKLIRQAFAIARNKLEYQSDFLNPKFAF